MSRLEGDVVELWAIDLDRPHAGAEAVLSPDERDRAARFHGAEHRARFVAARAALRGILSAHLGCGPAEVRMARGQHGKPCLADPATGLHFNLSHTARLAFAAVAREREVGVDLEPVPRTDVVTETARLVLCPREREHLAGLDEPARCREFARVWTRKEAYLKALGLGLAIPLDRLDAADTDEAPMLLREEGESARWAPDHAWEVRSVAAAPGHRAAIAVRGSGWGLLRCTWTGAAGGAGPIAPPPSRVPHGGAPA